MDFVGVKNDGRHEATDSSLHRVLGKKDAPQYFTAGGLCFVIEFGGNSNFILFNMFQPRNHRASMEGMVVRDENQANL